MSLPAKPEQIRGARSVQRPTMTMEGTTRLTRDAKGGWKVEAIGSWVS